MAGAGKRARWGRRHTVLALCVAAMFLSGEDCLWQRLVQSELNGSSSRALGVCSLQAMWAIVPTIGMRPSYSHAAICRAKLK